MAAATQYQQAKALVDSIRRYDPGAPAAVRAAVAAGLVGPDRFDSDVAEAAHLAGWAEAAAAAPAGADMVNAGSVLVDPDVLVAETRQAPCPSNESVYDSANRRGHLWLWAAAHRLILRAGDYAADAISAGEAARAAGRLAAAGRAFRRLGLDAGAFLDPAYRCCSELGPRTAVLAAAASAGHPVYYSSELRPAHERNGRLAVDNRTPRSGGCLPPSRRLGLDRPAALAVLRAGRHAGGHAGRHAGRSAGFADALCFAFLRPGRLRVAGRAGYWGMDRDLAASLAFATAETADDAREAMRLELAQLAVVTEERPLLLRLAAEGRLGALAAPAAPPALVPHLFWCDDQIPRLLARITERPPEEWPFNNPIDVRIRCTAVLKSIYVHAGRTIADGDFEERRSLLLLIVDRMRAVSGTRVPG
jgi:hypothetical protein